MDDLISRKALCKYALNQKDKSVTPNDIMRFPSAELKIGKWVLAHVGTIAEGYYCSRCGKYGHQTDFCLNCGAYMIDEEKMSIQVKEFKHISGENDDEFINLLLQHIEQQDEIIRKAVAKLTMGCTECVHYDQQQTALICHDCKRYYRDMYKEL